MATYQTKRCPKCGSVYERNTYSYRPSKDNMTKYGSPLKTCGRCKTMFIDRQYREMALEGVREVDTRRVSPQTIVLSLILFLMGLLNTVVIGSMAWILVGAGALLFLTELLSYNSRQRKMKKEMEASKKRMSDPVYAMILKRAGYSVPDSYFEKREREDV